MLAKPPPPRAAASRRLRRDHAAHEIVILLPDPHVLRVIARSVLLAAALLSFPWLRAALAPSAAAPAPPGGSHSKWVDSPFALRMLVADLKREGLFSPDLRSLFLGDPGCRAAFLTKNRIDLVSDELRCLLVEENSVDFVLAADGLGDSELNSVDRILKIGGIVAVPLGPDSARRPFRLPANYKMVYIRQFGSTVVGIEKISHANVKASKTKRLFIGRKFLSVATDELDEKQQPMKKAMQVGEPLRGGDSTRLFLRETKEGEGSAMSVTDSSKRRRLDALAEIGEDTMQIGEATGSAMGVTIWEKLLQFKVG